MQLNDQEITLGYEYENPHENFDYSSPITRTLNSKFPNTCRVSSEGGYMEYKNGVFNGLKITLDNAKLFTDKLIELKHLNFSSNFGIHVHIKQFNKQEHAEKLFEFFHNFKYKDKFKNISKRNGNSFERWSKQQDMPFAKKHIKSSKSLNTILNWTGKGSIICYRQNFGTYELRLFQAHPTLIIPSILTLYSVYNLVYETTEPEITWELWEEYLLNNMDKYLPLIEYLKECNEWTKN